MPESIVWMYIKGMREKDVFDRMNDIIEKTGENGLKSLPETDPSRKLYLKIQTRRREQELREHEEIKKLFKGA